MSAPPLISSSSDTKDAPQPKKGWKWYEEDVAPEEKKQPKANNSNHNNHNHHNNSNNNHHHTTPEAVDAHEDETVSDFKLFIRRCLDVVQGLTHLHKHNVLHRDIALRNCFVDNDGKVAVGDFGLARSVSDSRYYVIPENCSPLLPIRWLAPESMQNKKFSFKSDVWSLGVTLFELVTSGATPYSSLTEASQLPRLLEEGLSLKDELESKGVRRPPFSAWPETSHELCVLIMSCLQLDPDSRPTMRELVYHFTMLHMSLERECLKKHPRPPSATSQPHRKRQCF